ncbi:MAG: DUF2505 domain-containing protein [Bifidobacteriaceae bacterium]|jgi:hypothetical protein|nr:DUF2505 domain-containing protein [Bifidobacteriaceae bacterium]
MQLTASYDYSAPPGRVARLFADRGFQLEAAQAAGAESAQVEVTDGPDGAFTVAARATSPATALPAQVRGLLPAGLEIRQAQVWGQPGPDGARQASLAGEIVGAPIQLTGRLALAPAARGSRFSFCGQVKAQLPLLGPAIEQAAAPAIEGFWAALHRVAERWLA